MKKRILLVPVFFLMTACGGGSSNKAETNNPDQLKGLFATGSGQKGSILVKGSSGNFTAAISDQSGNFVVDLSGLTAPYKIKAESLDKDIVFYSYTENSTYTNVNQMTTSIFEDVAPQSNSEELFNSNVVINKSLLNEAEKALKNNLLVQIYSSGLEPDKLQIFKSKFTANNLGYDELLDKLSDESTPKVQSELTVEESKAISRIKSKLYFTSYNSVDIGKIDKDLINKFLARVVKAATDRNYMQTIYDLDGLPSKVVFVDGGKSFINNVMINVAKQSFIEIIGTSVGFSDADINFITELSSIKFKNNIYDAVAVLYLGLQGEDTSKIHDPLLVALQKSTLGDPIVASEKFIDFFGTHGTISRFICNLDDATAGTPSSALGEILNFNRTENCQFFENNNDDTLSDGYTIDFQTNQIVDVNYNDQPFRVTGVYPSTGNVVDNSNMINPTIFVNFNTTIDRSSVSTPFAMNVTNLTTGHTLVCNRLYVLFHNRYEGDEAESIECAFDDINLKYNSKYAFSITAIAKNTNDKLSVASTFSTPDYPVKTISLSSPSGSYDKSLNLHISVEDGLTYFYTINDTNMKKSNLKEYSGTPIELLETSILRIVAFKWGGFSYLQVSPVMEFPYTIIAKTEEEENSDDQVNNDTPIDTSSLTVQECKEKTLNQTFSTNAWTSSLSDWNAVVIACTSILANDQTNDNNSDDEGTSNNSKTSVSYMKSHPNEKLASTDCNAKSYNDWKVAKNSLISDLAPSTKMMKSIDGCISVKQLIDLGGLSFSKAVESVVRMQNKEKSPFSDAFDSSAVQTGTTDSSVDDISNQQDAFSEYTALIQKNTVSTCKAKYGQYSFLQLATIASTPRAEDIAVGQPINGDASYCQTLLLQSGDLTP